MAEPGRNLRSRLLPSLAMPGYGAAVRQLWETSHPLTIAVAAYAAAASVLPNLMLIAAGHLVGAIPAAAASGLNSAAGHRLITSLAVTGAAYAGVLVLGPAQTSLASVVKWRLVYHTQQRLMTAVSQPVSIAHLEDPKVHDDLELAQGQAVRQQPAEAPMTLALVVSNRASGLLACAVLASWRWWLGLGMLAMWVIARGMMRDVPLLLVLDEPTASLDAISEALLFERYLAARELASQAGAITLLVSHRFSTVRMADLIVVLDKGRITASGDHAALIQAGGLYAELYEMQARSYR